MSNNLPSACACLGPMYGEPVCPCVMKSAGIPRSQAYLDDNTSEAIEERRKKLNDVLSKVYNWDIK